MFVVAGEALIDLIGPRGGPYLPYPGGSPFNVAVALARLGVPTVFACPLSQDAFGDLLRKRLLTSNAQLLLPDPIQEPTALAIATLDSTGSANYAFYRQNTAERQVTPHSLCDALPSGVGIHHTGSNVLVDPQDREAWIALAKKAKDGGALISIDPNVRPMIIKDLAAYRHGLNLALALADIIKVSDEDLAVLYPQRDQDAAFQSLIDEQKPALAVLTLGAGGVRAVARSGQQAQQDAPLPGTLADTVGAGDCLSAGLLFSLRRQDIRSAKQLADISTAELQKALRFAAMTAGINCLRDGCDPPSLDDVMALY